VVTKGSFVIMGLGVRGNVFPFGLAFDWIL